MRDERVLITGCGGMLGNAVYPYFLTRFKHVLATDRDVTEHWLQELDVRDDQRLQEVFREFQPSIVLHLAAETNLEFCESNPDTAEDTNALATATVARLCKTAGATLVYVSSATIFDGYKNGFYTENDKPYPLMKYGRTKYDGEILATAYCHQTFVVRAGWMMGGGRNKDKKFIHKILQQVGNGSREIFAADDLWGTLTYTHDFAMNLLELIDTRRYGTYHMACEGAGNRYDVAREILQICRRSDIHLIPVISDFFREEYFVQRPRSVMMTNTNLRKLGCNHMRHWSTALRDYIETSYADFIADSEESGYSHVGYRPDSINEKRHKARQPINLAFTCTLHNGHEVNNCLGESLDISEGGLCLTTEHEMPLQSIVTIRVAASENWKRATMVRWSENNGSGYLVGLKYLEPPMIFPKMYARPQWGHETRAAFA